MKVSKKYIEKITEDMMEYEVQLLRDKHKSDYLNGLYNESLGQKLKGGLK